MGWRQCGSVDKRVYLALQEPWVLSPALFESSLVYRVSSKTVRATQRNPVSKEKKKNSRLARDGDDDGGADDGDGDTIMITDGVSRDSPGLKIHTSLTEGPSLVPTIQI